MNRRMGAVCRGRLGRDHHDVEVQEQAGRRLGKARLQEGIAGIARLHELLAKHLDADAQAGQVVIGIETDPGPVGAGAAGGRLSGVGDQSAAGGPLPPAAPRLGRQRRPRCRAPWRTWCAPTGTSCGRLPGTARFPRRSTKSCSVCCCRCAMRSSRSPRRRRGRRFLTPTGLRRELSGAAREEADHGVVGGGGDSTRNRTGGPCPAGGHAARPPVRQSAARRCAACWSAQLRSRPASTAASLISGCLVAVSSVNCRSLARPRRCASASARRGSCSSRR
jgi:hypothetical protein